MSDEQLLNQWVRAHEFHWYEVSVYQHKEDRRAPGSLSFIASAGNNGTSVAQYWGIRSSSRKAALKSLVSAMRAGGVLA